jgi:hypothetical protein
MSLRHWLQERGIVHEKVVAIHPATDGFKKGRDSLMSISMTGSWPDADIGTAFIAGADASKVQEYTGVSPELYAEHMIPLETAANQIKPVLEEADFAVIWYAQYSKSWLDYMLPELFANIPMLDVAPLCKAADQKIMLPSDDISIQEVSDRMTKATFHMKGGYKFEEVCSRVIPGVDGDTADAYLTGETPKLERQVYMLWALWTLMLDR